MQKITPLLFLLILIIPFTSAIICNPNLPNGCPTTQSTTTTFNNNSANVNNSLFWQGHTGTDGSWLTGISMTNTSYVPYTGATTNVDLGTKSLTTTNYIYTKRVISSDATTGALGIGTNVNPTGFLSTALGYQLTNTGQYSTIIGTSFGNTVDYAIALGQSGLDLLITSGLADFQDTNIVTTGNVTTSYGFFTWLGSLTNWITNGYVKNLNITNINISQVVSNSNWNHNNLTNVGFVNNINSTAYQVGTTSEVEDRSYNCSGASCVNSLVLINNSVAFLGTLNATNYSTAGFQGITGNYLVNGSTAKCWMNFSGGILYQSNC